MANYFEILGIDPSVDNTKAIQDKYLTIREEKLKKYGYRQTREFTIEMQPYYTALLELQDDTQRRNHIIKLRKDEMLRQGAAVGAGEIAALMKQHNCSEALECFKKIIQMYASISCKTDADLHQLVSISLACAGFYSLSDNQEAVQWAAIALNCVRSVLKNIPSKTAAQLKLLIEVDTNLLALKKELKQHSVEAAPSQEAQAAQVAASSSKMEA